MVTKIIHSKNIRAILTYNENKVRDREAELLMAAGYPLSPGQLSFNGKLERMLMLTRQNEGTKTNAMHVVISFSPEDKLDNDVMQSIALQFMEEIGFGAQPFLLYRHYDTYNPHLHIATVNIAAGGQRIETHNIGRNQAQRARRLIEELYGLVKAEEQQKQEDTLYLPSLLRNVVHGKVPTKATITAIVRLVTSTYKFTSIPELNVILRQFNLMAYRGPEDSRMYEKGGLVYCVLDENGAPGSQPIKASSIFGSPTLKNLEKQFEPNRMERKPFGERLRHQLDKALEGRPMAAELEQRLKKKGIRVLLRENDQGNIYGATFIDNSTRTVFNGSDLGKPYAAKSFMERLAGIGISLAQLSELSAAGDTIDPHVAMSGELETGKGYYPASGLPAIEIVRGSGTAESLVQNSPVQEQRTKKSIGLK